MLMPLKNIVIKLAEGKHLAFRDARGVSIECIEGVVWVTVEGQSGDFLLAKGERLRIESKGLALVQGMPSGAVQMVSEAICSIRRVDKFESYFDLITLLPRFVRANHTRDSF
jgi:hypothetical protein